MIVEVNPPILSDTYEEREERRLKVTEAVRYDLAEERDAGHGEDEKNDEEK